MKTNLRIFFATFGLILAGPIAHAQINLLVRNTDNTTQPFLGDANGNALDSVGASAFPTHTITLTGLTPTTSTNLLVIESGSAKTTIIRRIIIWPGTATANGYATITVNRDTVAATSSGTAATGTLMQHNQGDAVFSGIVRSGAFSVSGVTVTATNIILEIPTPISTTTTPAPPEIFDFTNGGTHEGLVVPVGVTNGISFTHSGLTGAANFAISVDFTDK